MAQWYLYLGVHGGHQINLVWASDDELATSTQWRKYDGQGDAPQTVDGYAPVRYAALATASRAQKLSPALPPSHLAAHCRAGLPSTPSCAALLCLAHAPFRPPAGRFAPHRLSRSRSL